MNYKNYLVSIGTTISAASFSASVAVAACATDGLPSSMERPGGYPERALTMIVPYGPAGGSGACRSINAPAAIASCSASKYAATPYPSSA